MIYNLVYGIWKIGQVVGSLRNTVHQCLSNQHVINHVQKFALKYFWFYNSYSWHMVSLGCTLVGLSTRPAPLIISKSLQCRTFCSQNKALFIFRCMLSVGSGSKMFGALKVTIYVKFFKLSVHKMSTFLRISACQWTMPSGLFAKKSHPKFFCSCQLLLVNSKMTR